MQQGLASPPADNASQQGERLGTLCIDFGYCTAAQVQNALKRQQQLRVAGLQLSLGQILREQKLITAAQLRALLDYLRRNELSRKRESSLTAAIQPEARKFGNYELLELVGEKDHGRIFKAHDTRNNRTIVLKVLPAEYAKDPQWRQRYQREVDLLHQLQHPNIETCYGGESINNSPTIMLEYLDGMQLSERLDREGNVTEREAWLITMEIAKGLSFAHRKGVLHRDIKPSHIWCSSDGRVKITDFVLARSVYDDMGLTSQGTTVGTPFFISPEQARGTDNLDARTDLYSLGCATYQMLTGSVPFLGDGVGETMMTHTRDARPNPREMLPEISEGSARLVMWMLAIEPGKRPQSADALINEINKLIPSLPEANSGMRPQYQVSQSDSGPLLSPNNSLTDDVELLADPAPKRSPSSPAARAPASRKTGVMASRTPAEIKKMTFWQRVVASINMLLGR
jgi:serine/threonine protein kinase